MANFSSSSTLFILGFTIIAAASSVRIAHLPRDKANTIPAFPFDINTAKHCVWWFDSDGTQTCQAVEAIYGPSIQDLVFWNPSLNAESCAFEVYQSYCVAALDEKHLGPGGENGTSPETVTATVTRVEAAPEPVPVTVTIVSTSVQTISATPVAITVVSTKTVATTNPPVTVTSVTTSVSVSVSVRTLIVTSTLPAVSVAPITVTAIYTSITILPGRVTSITQPYTVLVTSYSTSITTLPGRVSSVTIPVTATVTQTRTTTLTSTTTKSTLAVSSTTTTATATATRTLTITRTLTPSPCTPTKPGNGIATPSPIQEGMTTNCRSFYLVQAGDTCATIASRLGIPVDRFISWNPAAKKDCTSLWAGTYACVAVL